MTYISGVLPAVRKMKDFEKVMDHPHSELCIILESRISQLHQIVKLVKKKEKKIFVHADLINGLKVDQYGMEYLIRVLKVDGIISTRANAISMAKKNNIVAIQRLFAIDSSALEKNIELVEKSKPDYIEVLPGILPSVIQEVVERTGIPVIAGGFIRSAQEVQAALDSGAIAITTSNPELWNNN
ncbi:glycerol-3-phosphate responsive antiterminator [Gracilibacillus sp. YIM 98692]|uniref:glycerol-3-phosphate responsive antiterminator n=1 Tax=Gracilibacillus sp. YIM 98692 TaxID=2663532 RepID=UPI0013D5CB60|nr:glycerol-3-phosphate responsive antiterminator [Gracilibacillus sp. YIM 98692]